MENEPNTGTGTENAGPSRRPTGFFDRQLIRITAWFLATATVASVFGAAGSFCERYVSGYLGENDVPFLSFLLMDGSGAANRNGTTESAPSEYDPSDEALVGIVERSSSAVVSVVATKEVESIGRFGDLPFFFGPFGSGNDNGGNATEKREVGSGTGFFISFDGLIVTNKHVVSDEGAEYTVVVPGGEEYPAKVLARAANKDIAVLKVEGDGFSALSLGDSSALRVGQTVIAIGNPLGEFPNSVSRGIISGLNRNVTAGSSFGDTETLSDIIQTDAAINPGNSGGPLLDLSGKVVGINVAVAQGAENIGFAIPIDQVSRIIEEVRTTGRLSMPYLGVRYAMIDDDIAKENDLPYAYGAIVLRGTSRTELAVVPGSPADKAGIVENDIILEIDGEKLDADHILSDVVSDHRAGDTVTLRIWHKGEEKEVEVILGERDS